MVDAYYGPTNADPTYSLGGTAAGIEVNLAMYVLLEDFSAPIWFGKYLGTNSHKTELPPALLS